jgi:hypothetical protein
VGADLPVRSDFRDLNRFVGEFVAGDFVPRAFCLGAALRVI